MSWLNRPNISLALLDAGRTYSAFWSKKTWRTTESLFFTSTVFSPSSSMAGTHCFSSAVHISSLLVDFKTHVTAFWVSSTLVTVNKNRLFSCKTLMRTVQETSIATSVTWRQSVTRPVPLCLSTRKMKDLANKTNLVHNLFLVHLSASACFGRRWAHHQEKQLCLCNTWYLSFCVDDCLVCRLHPAYQRVIHTITNAKCRINTLVSPDDEPIVARNTYRLINILRINCAPSWFYLQVAYYLIHKL